MLARTDAPCGYMASAATKSTVSGGAVVSARAAHRDGWDGSADKGMAGFRGFPSRGCGLRLGLREHGRVGPLERSVRIGRCLELGGRCWRRRSCWCLEWYRWGCRSEKDRWR